MKASDSFPRELPALARLFAFAEAFAAGQRLPESRRFTLKFVLEELFTNMVRHNPGAGGRIEVELAVAEGELLIELRDTDCPRFDLRTDAPAVDPDLPLEARTPGGLGIHLVKQLVDRIEYHHEGRLGRLRLATRID